MEINTCEQYVLNELKMAQDKIAALEAQGTEDKNTLKYASNVLGLFGELLELVEDEKNPGKYFVKMKGEDKDMFFDVSTEGGKKAFAYLAPILLPGYNKGKKNEADGGEAVNAAAAIPKRKK